METNNIFSGYQIISQIGRGNTSRVCLAIDPEGRHIALKLPHAETLKDKEAAERFANEVRLTLQFKHPNIVRGYAGTTFGALAHLALEYHSQGSLSDKINKGKLPLLETISILSDVAAALSYIHANNAVHQDIKTQNVYITPKGKAELGDLGSAYFVSQGGKPAGSPFYMAPEIYEGETSSSASDVYSLGIMMYELLAGKRPYQGDTYEELMIAHMTSFPKPLQHLNAEVTKPLAKLVELSISKKAKDRPSAEAIHGALQEILNPSPEPELPVPPVEMMGRHSTTAAAAVIETAKKPNWSSRWNPFNKRR